MTEEELMDWGSQEPDWEEISGELWLQRERILRFINRTFNKKGETLKSVYNLALRRLRWRMEKEGTKTDLRYWPDLESLDPDEIRRKW